MGSKKRSAQAKERAAFRESLYEESLRSDGNGFGDLFAREEARLQTDKESRDAAKLQKACLSKNRYATLSDAEEARDACATAGRRGLSVYRCPHCKGWHLTSHPQA